MINQLDDFVCDIQCEEYYDYLAYYDEVEDAYCEDEELMNYEDEAEIY